MGCEAKRMRAILLGAVLTAAAAAPLQAQSMLAFRLTPYGGYVMFGEYIEGPANVSLTNRNAALFGAQLTFNLTPSLGIFGNFGYSRSSWSLEDVPILGDRSLGKADLLLYDAGIHVAFPAGVVGKISPFVQLGVGAIRYGLDDNLVTELLDRTSATNFAANGGVGLDVQLGRVLGARVMAKDYLVSFSSNRLQEFRLEGKWAHNVAFSLGINLGF